MWTTCFNLQYPDGPQVYHLLSRPLACAPDHRPNQRAPSGWSTGTSNPKLNSATFPLPSARHLKTALLPLPVAVASVNGTSTPSPILILTPASLQGRPICHWFYIQILPLHSRGHCASVDLDFKSSLLTCSDQIYVPLVLILQIVAGCFGRHIWLSHLCLIAIDKPWITHRSQRTSFNYISFSTQEILVQCKQTSIMWICFK